MKVVLTGSLGLIGRRVEAMLLAQGHAVLAPVSTQAASRCPELMAEHRVALDLESTGEVRAWLAEERPEAAIHLAWRVPTATYLDSHENLASMQMSVGLIEALVDVGCKTIVGAGSCAEYGLSREVKRESDAHVAESLYGRSKYCTYLMGSAIAAQRGARLSWGRIFHAYGPGEAPDRLLPTILRALRSGKPVDVTAGEQLRDQIHIDDVAAAFMTLLEHGSTGVYNIGTGVGVPLREVLETLADLAGYKDALRFGGRPYSKTDVMHLVGDSTKLRALGWAPAVGLREGLVDLLSA